MSWNIKTPGDYINGPLTVAGVTQFNSNVGVGISPTSRLHIGNTAAATRITITDDIANGRSGYIESNYSDALVIGTTSGVRAIRFSPDGKPYYQIATDGVQTWLDGVGGTRMMLNSSGLGIGGNPSSYVGKLVVLGAPAATSGAIAYIRDSVANGSNNSLGSIMFASNPGADFYVGKKVSGGTAWFSIGNANNGNEYVVLDPNGNLGLGVAANNWASLYRAQTMRNHISQFAFWDNSDSLGGLVNGAYINSSYTWTYSLTGKKPSMYVLSEAGNHVWSVAGTGTVGGAVTWTSAMTLTSNGELLIGTTVTPGAADCTAIRKGSTGQLILVANNGGLYQQVQSNYYLVTTAGGSTSDKTLKKNIEQLTGALSKVCAIRGVNFEFIEKPKCTADQGIQVGVIAQEVESQFPEIVLTGEDGIKRVRYERLIAPLIEAIKELTARVVTLENA